MRMSAPALVIVLLGFLAVGCGSGPPVDTDLLDPNQVRMVGEAPTQSQYRSARSGVLSSLRQAQGVHADRAGSIAATVKSVVASVGLTVGLAGTVASFLLEDEADRATIAQLSATVAGVSGVFGLVPIGNGAATSRRVASYLDREIQWFERAWPEDRDPISADEWTAFQRDANKISDTLTLLEE